MVLPRSTSMHLKSSPATSPMTASDSLWFLQAGVRYFSCACARHTLAFVSSSISIVHNTAAAHCARAAAPREMERGGKRGKAVKRKREKKSVRRTRPASAAQALQGVRVNAHAPAFLCALACWSKVGSTCVFAALQRRVRRAASICPATCP